MRLTPPAIVNSRTIWSNFGTPFILSAFILGFYGFGEGKRWAQVVCLPIMLIGLQIHFAAWLLLPIFFWFLWIGRKNISWRALAASAVLGALVMLPFVIGLTTQPEGSAGNKIQEILSIIQYGLRWRVDPLKYMAQLAVGTGDESAVVPLTPLLFQQLRRPDALWFGIGILSLTGLLVIWTRRWRPLAVFMALWVVVPPLVFIPSWTGNSVQRHHFIPMIPGLSLLAALGLVWLTGWLTARFPRRKYLLKTALFGLFCAAALSQGTWVQGLIRFQDEHYVETPTGQTATPLHYLMDVRAVLSQYSDVVIVGGNPDETNHYVWRPMLYFTAQCVRDVVVAGGHIAVFPNGPFAAVIPPNADPYPIPDLYRTDSPVVIPLRPGEDPYTIYAFDAAPEWNEMPITPVDALPFDNGVRLTGYHLTAEKMFLRWKLGDHLNRDIYYFYFGHFLDSSGERVGQRDTGFWPGEYWCEGDTLITWVDTPVPPETATLRVGMYHYEGDRIINSSLVDDAGNPVASWFDIPLETPAVG